MTHTTRAGGELRRNAVSGKLTIVAPARAARPHDVRGGTEDDALRAGRPGGATPCPFCAGNEALTPPEIEATRPPEGAPDTPGWSLRVVPNKYPVLEGRHEVIVHSPDHAAELEDLPGAHLDAAVACYQRRIGAHLEGAAAAAVLIINRGAGSGASLAHPHAQLFALPLIPPLLQDELMQFERHRNRYGTCVLCDEMERADDRLVCGGDFVAWTPEAPRFQYEMWLAPATHAADVRDADPTPLARALRSALVAIGEVTAGGPFNVWLHTAPADLRGWFHWHLEFAPRLSALAGFELGCDMAVASVDPLRAATELRAAWPA